MAAGAGSWGLTYGNCNQEEESKPALTRKLPKPTHTAPPPREPVLNCPKLRNMSPSNHRVVQAVHFEHDTKLILKILGRNWIYSGLGFILPFIVLHLNHPVLFHHFNWIHWPVVIVKHLSIIDWNTLRALMGCCPSSLCCPSVLLPPGVPQLLIFM